MNLATVVRPRDARGVEIKTHDFNGADVILAGDLAALWEELRVVLTDLRLHLSPSRERGKVGEPVFDPKATNKAVKDALGTRAWPTDHKIPKDWQFLGKGVDYFHSGLLGEAQFSNYPFFLNNIVRSSLLAMAKVKLEGEHTIRVVVVVVKAHMFPAAQSTLYFEQAEKQLAEFYGKLPAGILDVPVRLVGLFSDFDVNVPAVWSTYAGPGARVPQTQKDVACVLSRGPRANSAITITIKNQPV